jgi:hypothetical protein
MSLATLLLFALVGALLLLLAWALRGPARQTKPGASPDDLEETGGEPLNFLPQIRQALASADYEFLAARGLPGVQRRVRRERQDVALAYLSALRKEFRSLLRMARIIAVLSPEIEAVQEFQRLRLTVTFLWRYELIRMKLLAGFAPLPQLESLSNLISGLSVRLEAAMKELGERAAFAAELASSADRRRIDLV